MSQFRPPSAPEIFAYSQIGSAALVSLEAAHIRPPTEAHASETRTEGGASVNWGASLHPHHFNFDEATSVKARLSGNREISCRAVSVLGAGQFQESPQATPVEFQNGGILVEGRDAQGGNRYKLFTFDDFRRRFLLEDGTPVETIYQIDYQTPRK
jgi:hypothetical protein